MLKVVNIFHVGERQYNWDELTEEQKSYYGQKMNDAALAAIGYERTEKTKEA